MFDMRRELTLGLIASSSATAPHNQSIIHRSWALLDEGRQYGLDFYYNEYEEVPSTIAGIKAKMGRKPRARSPVIRQGFDRYTNADFIYRRDDLLPS
jgi:hypothetical protein